MVFKNIITIFFLMSLIFQNILYNKDIDLLKILKFSFQLTCYFSFCIYTEFLVKLNSAGMSPGFCNHESQAPLQQFFLAPGAKHLVRFSADHRCVCSDKCRHWLSLSAPILTSDAWWAPPAPLLLQPWVRDPGT